MTTSTCAQAARGHTQRLWHRLQWRRSPPEAAACWLHGSPAPVESGRIALVPVSLVRVMRVTVHQVVDMLSSVLCRKVSAAGPVRVLLTLVRLVLFRRPEYAHLCHQSSSTVRNRFWYSSRVSPNALNRGMRDIKKV